MPTYFLQSTILNRILLAVLSDLAILLDLRGILLILLILQLARLVFEILAQRQCQRWRALYTRKHHVTNFIDHRVGFLKETVVELRDFALRVDDEDLAGAYRQSSVRNVIGVSVAEAGVEGLAVLREEVLHFLEALYLEEVRLLYYHFAIHALHHAVGAQEERAVRHGMLHILLNILDVILRVLREPDRS